MIMKRAVPWRKPCQIYLWQLLERWLLHCIAVISQLCSDLPKNNAQCGPNGASKSGRADVWTLRTSERRDVWTLGRPDVQTSGRLDVQRSGRPTSERPDVQTSGHLDVPMRSDVRTSGHPDVRIEPKSAPTEPK